MQRREYGGFSRDPALVLHDTAHRAVVDFALARRPHSHWWQVESSELRLAAAARHRMPKGGVPIRLNIDWRARKHQWRFKVHGVSEDGPWFAMKLGGQCLDHSTDEGLLIAARFGARPYIPIFITISPESVGREFSNDVLIGDVRGHDRLDRASIIVETPHDRLPTGLLLEAALQLALNAGLRRHALPPERARVQHVVAEYHGCAIPYVATTAEAVLGDPATGDAGTTITVPARVTIIQSGALVVRVDLTLDYVQLA